MFQKAEQLGVPVEDFRNNQASLQAEQARIQKDIAVKEKRLEALVDEMDKGVHKSLIASTVAAIGGVVAAIFKAVKGKPNSKLKNAAILSGSAVIPGAVAWFLTSLFAVNPKKSEAIALSEELDAPRKEVEKLDEKIVAGTQKFHQDFIVALLKHNIQDYARQQQAETEEIKNAKPKDVEKQTKEITAKEKPGSPAKKIIDKISPVLSGGHKGKINEVREQQAAESQTQLSV